MWCITYYDPPPRGNLDLLWFPVIHICVAVHPHQSMHRAIHVHPRPSVPDLIYAIFPTVFTSGFQIVRYGDHGQDLEMIKLFVTTAQFSRSHGVMLQN